MRIPGTPRRSRAADAHPRVAGPVQERRHPQLEVHAGGHEQIGVAQQRTKLGPRLDEVRVLVALGDRGDNGTVPEISRAMDAKVVSEVTTWIGLGGGPVSDDASRMGSRVWIIRKLVFVGSHGEHRLDRQAIVVTARASRACSQRARRKTNRSASRSATA